MVKNEASIYLEKTFEITLHSNMRVYKNLSGIEIMYRYIHHAICKIVCNYTNKQNILPLLVIIQINSKRSESRSCKIIKRLMNVDFPAFRYPSY